MPRHHPMPANSPHFHHHNPTADNNNEQMNAYFPTQSHLPKGYGEQYVPEGFQLGFPPHQGPPIGQMSSMGGYYGQIGNSIPQMIVSDPINMDLGAAPKNFNVDVRSTYTHGRDLDEREIMANYLEQRPEYFQNFRQPNFTPPGQEVNKLLRFNSILDELESELIPEEQFFNELSLRRLL